MPPNISPVPIDTGRLISSFDIASTPRSIVMQWSAVKPTQPDVDYAIFVDQGGRNVYAHDFSGQMRNYARERLLFHLQAELQAIGSVTP